MLTLGCMLDITPAVLRLFLQMRILILAVLASGCAGTITEERGLTAAWFATSAISTCDYGQTLYAAHGGAWDRASDRPGYKLGEMNPLLGERPSVDTLSKVWLVDQVALTGTRIAPMPKWIKWAIFGAVTALDGYTVVTNHGKRWSCGI